MNGFDEHGPWRGDLAAYLLGSLEDDERTAVESHLDGCDACREQLRWLQPAIDLLPEAVAQVEPPPQLRERLLAEVGSEAASEQAAQTNKHRRASDRRGFLRGFLLRPATGLAALALVAAGVFGYTFADSDTSQPTTTTQASGVGSLHATLKRSGDSGTLKLTGLEQAPRSRVYQAWVQVQGGQIDPVGSLFDARHNGTANVSLERHLDGAKAVMVTLEPRHGSSQPTSPPLLTMTPRH